MADRRPLYRDAASGQLTEIGVPIDDSTPGHTGEILIWDSVSHAYVPGDPLITGNDLIDTGNSSTAPLGANAAFTGTSHATTGYAQLVVSVDSDRPSASAADSTGIVVQWSEDGTNWGDYDWGTFSSTDAGFGQGYSFAIKRAYYRVVYTNGATPQTYFRLQSILKVISGVGRLMDLIDTIDPNTHAMVVRNRLFGSVSYGAGTFNDCVIKNPSTAAVAGDPALVVAVSPNNTLQDNIAQFGGSAVSLGQQTAANSIPVILPSATITALTPPTTVTAKLNDGSGNSIGSTSSALNVYVSGGSVTGGTQYADPTTNSGPMGTVAMGKNASNVLHALSLDSSGNLNINVAASTLNDPAEGSTGSAVPAKAIQMGGSDGTNLQALLVDANKYLKVNVATSTALSVSGTATVTPAGSTIWQVSPTTSANSVSNPFFETATDNAGHALTVNSTTTTSKYAQDMNILSILGTAPTTVGKLDVKSADGDVFVRSNAASTFPVTATIASSQTIAVTQGTAANLNATVTGSVNVGTVTTLPSLVAGSATIGKVDLLGNTGAVLDGVNTAATAPANGILTLGIYNSTLPTPSTGQSVGIQVDAAGMQKVNIGAAVGANSKTNPGYVAIADATNVSALTATGTAPSTSTYSLPVAAVLYAGATPTAIGTPQAAGTGTLSGAALTTNSAMYIGTAAVSASVPVPISATAAANTKTNEMFVNITDHTNSLSAALSALGTAPTGTEVMAVNAVLLPFVASGAGLSTAVSQALTTTINVKASAGQLYGYAYSNPNSAVAYVEFYNTATTPGTIGSTTNLIYEMMIPAGAAANIALPIPIYCSAGIAVAVATTATGSTAPTTGLTITTFYK
jgi:hypothetical protein